MSFIIIYSIFNIKYIYHYFSRTFISKFMIEFAFFYALQLLWAIIYQLLWIIILFIFLINNLQIRL